MLFGIAGEGVTWGGVARLWEVFEKIFMIFKPFIGGFIAFTGGFRVSRGLSKFSLLLKCSL